MRWTVVERRTLALGGSSIDERLRIEWTTEPAVEPEVADRRWGEWLESATTGDVGAFGRALAGEGLDEARARRAIGAAAFPVGAPEPAWVGEAQWLVEAATTSSASVGPAEVPVPFDPIVRAMGEAMVRRVERGVGAPGGPAWLPSARAMLGQRFAHDLGELCGPTLLAAFAATRPAPGEGSGPASTTAYETFVERLRSGLLGALLLQRPVLARLAGEQAASAVAAATELLERLGRDRPEIERDLCGGAALGPIERIETGLSDRHDGRTVAILGFAGGRRLVYKPRDCRIDGAWAGLTGWLAAQGPGLDLRAPRVLARPGYGWIEFIETAPCADVAAVGRFYRRYGVLLALAWLLGSRDLHAENVLAAGEHPVPVDLETLLCPDLAAVLQPPPGSGARQCLEVARQRIERAVTQILLLPSEAPAAADRSFSVGALTPPGPRPWEGFGWDDLNTDRMRRVRRAGMREPEVTALAVLEGRVTVPVDHVEEIVAGFEAAARAVLAHRDEVLAPSGPLALLAGAEIRVVLRGTQFYMLLLQRARAIRNLGDGIAWSRHLYYLWRHPPARPVHWRLMARERASLARGDVPRFVVPTDGTELGLGEGSRGVPVFPRSALAEARATIAALDEEVIAREVRRIWTAFGVEPASPARGPAGPRGAPERRRLATALAETIAAEAIEASGGAAWMTRMPVVAHGSASSVAVAGPDLYGGSAGIALFLGAAAAVEGAPRWRRLALAAVAPVREEIGERPTILVERLGLGGASGAGSVVYALTRLGTLLRDDALLADAGRLAGAIGPEAIHRDRTYDVIGGSAGLVLGLLHLYRAVKDRSVLARAEAAGDHLLGQRATAQGFRVWASGRQPALTGFSHGAAGIAVALARLATLTGQARFREAAAEAIAFERACYAEDRRGWPDLRTRPEGGEPDYPCQWCHGAAGIGLARLATRPHLDDPAIDAEVQVALDRTLAEPPARLDHYCCGNLGRVELLFAAAQAGRGGELAEEAGRRLEAMVEARDRNGRFRWLHGPDDENLSLFQGLAGVGYQALRMEHPEILPSVLSWE